MEKCPQDEMQGTVEFGKVFLGKEVVMPVEVRPTQLTEREGGGSIGRLSRPRSGRRVDLEFGFLSSESAVPGAC